MNTEALFKTFDFQRYYLSLLIDDIAEDQMTAQPGKVVNHPAWQLGHLAEATDFFVQVIGGEKRLDEKWSKLFAANTTPVNDRSLYPSKAKLIEVLDDRRNALVRRCMEMSEADWQSPHNILPLASLPTKWHVVHFVMLTHESTHLGQLASWRHAQGLPMALSKLRMES
jgi:hypothetical protein